MSSFSIGGLECHFPIIKNFIAFVLFVKLLWKLVEEDKHEVKILHFFVNNIIKSPLVMTWTIPKFNQITIISFEEFPKFPRDYRWLDLIQINWWIKTESKIHFATYNESMIMIMQLMLTNWVTWLIPHLIAKSLALVKVTLTTW